MARVSLGDLRNTFASDAVAGVITALLLIPQAIAYALLAGLPAWSGLYAAVIPVLTYAVTGTSRVMSVGPVAVAAIMVNQALADLGLQTEAELVAAAAVLSLLVGLSLLCFSFLRGGAMVRFISQPVLSGFVTGAALLIIASQCNVIAGGSVRQLMTLTAEEWLQSTAFMGVLMGLVGIVLLLLVRSPLIALLTALGVREAHAKLLSRAMPAALVIFATGLVWHFEAFSGVPTVGAISGGFAQFNASLPALSMLQALILPALMIATIGYVESISVAKSLASRRRERVEPNREMRAIGLSNLAASLVSAMPVAGGFSRSVVNFEAGARTQLASVIAAVLVAAASLSLGGFFEWMPKAILAAIIIVAVGQLIELREFVSLLRQTPADALVFAVTVIGVLVSGLEAGLVAGIMLSLAQLIFRSSAPHIAVVGRIAGSEHFRNVCRHRVETQPGLLMIRIDENLVFTNAEAVEQFIRDAVYKNKAKDLVLIMTSVSHIDATARHMLDELNASMAQNSVTLHLAEVKGPVMDGLMHSQLHGQLRDRVYLSANCAFESFRRGQIQEACA